MTTHLIEKISKITGLKPMQSTKSWLQELKVSERFDKVLLVLLDTSGSMTESMGTKMKIDVAWHVLQTQLLPNMAGWTYGMIGFSDNAYWIMYPIGNTTALSMSSLKASGLTAMGQALTLAWTWTTMHAKEARFILLSDGKPNDITEQEILKRATQNNSIPIDTVGIGIPGNYDYNPEFLKQLSTITGGLFSEVDNAQHLMDIIKKLSPRERPLLGKVKGGD